jgi:hypothetical protein
MLWIGVIKVWVQENDGKIFGKADFAEFCLYENCMLELSIEMAIIFIGKGLLYHLDNALEPFLTWLPSAFKTKQFFSYMKNKRYARLADKKILPSTNPARHREPQLHADKNLTNVNAQNTEISGYNSATLQFGFVVLFSVAFSLAPFLGCLHNIVQKRIGIFVSI